MIRSTTITKFIEQSRILIPSGSSITVAVSGGSDSIALLYLLTALKEELAITKIVVVHCNYGLRGNESDADEELVKSYATLLNHPFFSKRFTGHSLRDTGMELWARDERYAFLHEVADANGCNLIATGHTLDDQAETVLMRMLRGTGLNGLRAIAAKRRDGIVRPMLTIRKCDLVKLLNENRIAYRTDASNSDTRFFRNKIRHELLPCIERCHERALEHIAALATDAQEHWGVREELVEQWIKSRYIQSSKESFIVNWNGVMDHTVAAEAFRQLLIMHDITPDRFHITALFNRAPTLLLPNKWVCHRGEALLYFERSNPIFSHTVSIPGTMMCSANASKIHVSIEPVPEQLDSGKNTVFVDADYCGNQLLYRSITSRDTFIPFGRSDRVNIFQFLSKQGVNAADRYHGGIITTSDNKPVWIPAIRQDERFRVTSKTKKVVKIQSTSFF